jgi:hypothetical protein
MKQPLKRDTPLDHNRYNVWREFIAYRQAADEGRIDRWLMQFAKKDRDLAARILDTVEFITYDHMSAAFSSVMASLPGWDYDPKKRKGNWRFAPFSGSAGESGDDMIYKFRASMRMNFKKYRELFIHRSDLVKANLGPKDSLVLVDDIAGTGDQACDAWEEFFKELLPRNPNIYLILVRASVDAIEKILNETAIQVVPYQELTAADNIFAPNCKFFDGAEKKTILHYCQKADAKLPKGYGDSGLVVVFCHRCPNNSIPILHANHNKWRGLFPRH